MAERLLRHGLAQRLGADDASRFDVTSAGTSALVGDPIHDVPERLLVAAGADGDGFAATQLDEAGIHAADLILAMTRGHRADIATTAPGCIRRLFTLREFARLTQGASVDATDPVERARALVTYAAEHRGENPPSHPGDDDVGDPYGGPDAGYRRSFDLIAEPVGAIVAAFAP
jgi:protein-tyrosine phosphatase